ncbi:DUF6175 family protein [Balneolales bacterium ANBcel1]|nr:DUF6175 family protein [Balneolales bacterium ANBcel1]
MMKKRTIAPFLFLVLFSITAQAVAPDLPVSRQARLVERTSPAEVMIEATGIYRSSESRSRRIERDLNDNGVTMATRDAKKAAVWFLLFGSTDPMLSTDDARNRFRPYESHFFDLDHIEQWIAWEQTGLVERVRTVDGTGLQITKRFRINTEMINSELERFRIIEARSDLTEAIGRPFVMVLPQTASNQSPIELLQSDQYIRHAAAVVESFLTSRLYDVVVPEQVSGLDQMISALNLVEGQQEDYAYQIAQQIGSDIYITFSSTEEDAGFGTTRTSMLVRAFETTTGRLLGTETGYSQGRRGERSVSIEEAMNDAIDKVLSRINNYWVDDMSRGIQYKIVLNIPDFFSRDDIEDIQFAFMDAVDAITRSSRENIATSRTLDYLIWCDPGEYANSRNVYRSLMREFNRYGGIGRIRSVTINRKLLVLEVDRG